MSLDYSDMIKEGYVKEKTKNLGMLKKRWLVLRQQSSQGANRLQVFADRDAAVAADGRPLKQFLLADIVSITGVAPNRSHYGFTIQMADSSQLFVCDTGHEAEDWEKKLQTAVRNGDRIIYLAGSVHDLENVFHVCLLTSVQLEHSGECLLHVSADTLSLLDASNPQHQLASWPLVALRRYGSESDTFTFESGRSCETGEGLFCLSTIHADAVHKAVKSATVAFAAAFRIARMTADFNKTALKKSHSVPEVASVASIKHTPVCGTRSSPTTAPAPAQRFTVPENSPSQSANRPLPDLPGAEVVTSPAARAAGVGVEAAARAAGVGAGATGGVGAGTGAGAMGGAEVKPPTAPRPTAANSSANARQDEYESYLDPEFRKFLAKRREDPV